MRESAQGILNSTSEMWMQWLLVHFIETLILAAIISVFWLLIAKRATPQFGVLLFLLIPLKLLIFPFFVPVPLAIAQYMPTAYVQSIFEELQVADESDVDAELVIQQEPAEEPTDDSQSGTVDQLAESMEGESPAQLLGPVVDDSAPVITELRADSDALTFTSVAFLGWCLITFVLLVRFVLVQYRFALHADKCEEVIGRDLSIDLSNLCQQMGVRQRVRLLRSTEISCPVVWGIFRPRILIPEEFEKSVQNDRLDWALLHELAHVRRLDLLFVFIQRVATLLNWFNPAIWVANRWIDHLREFACDDLASSVMKASPIESGQAFVEMIRFSTMRQLQPSETLGVFGWHRSVKHSSIGLRLKRLLDDSRIIRTSISKMAIVCLIMFSIVALPSLYAMNSLADDNVLEIVVLDQDQKPVSFAKAFIHGEFDLVDHDVTVGKLSLYKDGIMTAETDESGVLKLSFVALPEKLSVAVSKNWVGSKRISWDVEKGKVVPANWRAVLEPFTYGGVVTDEAGNPVAGARVNARHTSVFPSNAQVSGVTKTNDLGEWFLVGTSMPPTVEINHPDYESVLIHLSDKKFLLTGNAEKALSDIKIRKGLLLEGRIVDSQQKPISGAEIRVRSNSHGFVSIKPDQTSPSQSTLVTTSDANGNFRFGGCYSGSARLIVAADRFALDMKKIDVQPKMKPMSIQLEKSKKLTLRVVDENNRPVPQVNILLASWRDVGRMGIYYPMHERTDQNGVWVWNEAPADEFSVFILSGADKKYLNQFSPKVVGGKEYTTVLKSRQNLVGRVVDAETKKPIKTFNVIPGVVKDDQSKSLNWKQMRLFNWGQYEYPRSKLDRKFFLRIESGGYMPVETKIFDSNEDSLDINLELQPTNRDSVVLLPNNQPAVGAKVLLPGRGGEILRVKNGDLSDEGRVPGIAQVKVTDEAGRVEYETKELQFLLHGFKNDGSIVVTHPKGFACLMICNEGLRESDDVANAVFVPRLPKTIRLTPWAKVKGVLRSGDKVLANQQVEIGSMIHRNLGDFIPEFSFINTVLTNDKGEFVFERVVPGKSRIGHMPIRGQKDLVTSVVTGVETQQGITTVCNVGAGGHTVKGRLNLPDQPAVGRFPSVFLEPDLKQVRRVKPKGLIDGTYDFEIWSKQWRRSDAGKRFLEYENKKLAAPIYKVSTDDDGRFSFVGIPPGDYVVTTGSFQPYSHILKGRAWNEHFISDNYNISIGPNDDPKEVTDVGVIQLKNLPKRKAR